MNLYGPQGDVPKQKPQDAGYRQGDEQMNCGMCANFVSPSSCAKVSGAVESSAVCNLFQPLESELNQDALMSQLFGGTNG